MTDGFLIGRIVQGACRHSNILFIPGMPEKRRSAFAAESTMNVGGFICYGFEPFQASLFHQGQILEFDTGIRAKAAVKTPAF